MLDVREKRNQGRALIPEDLVRPVQSGKEHALFVLCYQLHTENRKTDWEGIQHQSGPCMAHHSGYWRSVPQE